MLSDVMRAFIGGMLFGFAITACVLSHLLGNEYRELQVQCGVAHYDVKTGKFIEDKK